MIEDEIKDAEKYAKKALEMKDTDRTLADVFFNLSTEETRHMNILHGEVARMITEYRRTNGEPPAAMLTLYEILHERHINDAAAVKVLQNMYLE
jgi:Mn-containing catalase